jgi:uncharacterized membrane protein YozB (DUF420 family)
MIQSPAQYAIKRGSMAAHRGFMIAAVLTSSIFLASYLYEHATSVR